MLSPKMAATGAGWCSGRLLEAMRAAGIVQDTIIYSAGSVPERLLERLDEMKPPGRR